MMFDTVELRRPLAAAIAWQLIGQIARRYVGQSALSVLEMHPGGGMYDLLTLWEGEPYTDDARQLAGLNLLGTAHRVPLDEERYPWLVNWLFSSDTKISVEELATFARLMLTDKPNPTTRAIFGLRMIAAVLATEAFGRKPLDARMAYSDTSGFGSGVGQEVRALLGPLLTRYTDAARWWMLRKWPDGPILSLLSVNGWMIPASAPGTRLDLFRIFQRRRGMTPAVRFCLEMMES